MTHPFETRNAAETRAVGEALGRLLPGGTVVLLRGGLGAGKTTFAQGIARGMGIRDRVISPSFTLVREYLGCPSCPRLLHADLYRLADAAEARSLGLDELPSPDDVLVVEWPERADAAWGGRVIAVDLSIAGGDARRIVLACHDADMAALLARLALLSTAPER